MEAQGLAENTIVVLWGDHGWHLGDQRIWGKHTCFDVALRSPLIIKHPKREQGIKVKEVVGTVDIYPTLMDFCQIPLPQEIDGHSLKGLLNKTEKGQNIAYSYYNKGISMRRGQYRLTQYFRSEKPTIELYDLKNDPHETKNIGAEKPKIVRKLMPFLEKGNTGLYQK